MMSTLVPVFAVESTSRCLYIATTAHAYLFFLMDMITTPRGPDITTH